MRAGAIGLAGLALMGGPGCQGTSSRRTVANAEPELSINGEKGSGFASASRPPARTVGIVERHPLLSKPREMYDKSGNNKVVKVAGATLVGIPMGVAGELRQIFVGAAPATR